MKPKGGAGQDDWIRTSDFVNPNHALYQAELHPVKWSEKRDSNPWKDNTYASQRFPRPLA